MPCLKEGWDPTLGLLTVLLQARLLLQEDADVDISNPRNDPGWMASPAYQSLEMLLAQLEAAAGGGILVSTPSVPVISVEAEEAQKVAPGLKAGTGYGTKHTRTHFDPKKHEAPKP